VEIGKFIYLKTFPFSIMAIERQTMADVITKIKAKRERQGKHRWIDLYVGRLNSEGGMAADAILKEETARRRREGVAAIKLRTIERVLNKEGFPLYGTARKGVAERRNFTTTLPPTNKGVGQLIQRVRGEVTKLERMIEAVGLSPAEQEFCYLWMENYPDEVIVGLMELGDVELKNMKELLGLEGGR